jgi:hypothetical protein
MSAMETNEKQVEKADILHSEVLVNADLMNDAFDGENREHEMGTWEAVKAHPWACLWAFTMCFTIVSLCCGLSPDSRSRSINPNPDAEYLLMLFACRLWNRSTCS